MGGGEANHYENLSIQYTEIFLQEQLKISLEKKNDIFDIFVQNTDCGYMLEPPC